MNQYDIDYQRHIAKGFVEIISNGLESFSDYKQTVAENPTTNHLGHKRMDEINKYMDRYLINLQEEGFLHHVITAGRSPYQVLMIFDTKKKNLILLKRVESIDSLPRNMFKSPGDDVSEYIQEYAQVNRRLSYQLEFEFDKQNDLNTFNHTQLEQGFEYNTLAFITFVIDKEENLTDIAIGVPAYDMNSWIHQNKWSQFIVPGFEEPHADPNIANDDTSKSGEQKYRDIIKRKNQEKQEGR
ncbi:hypothetical protein GCM10007063_21500 [Lentibacillus kapialis]|uniref:Uncharacterized protein n=1 Tax=Lentibacillus kapialis TaxID=340214 RepID=A0A917UZ12_9BACI|nr:DUF5986 family protein [Lentibacillus kapialis]GGJ98915.1 hypothetical protein GCM10007063_21500 [Lentibacillus kapialis]